jgi:hypothetical protein
VRTALHVYQLHYFWLPHGFILSHRAKSKKPTVLRLLEALARAKEYDKANFPIFFHCNSGMHRAPTLALAFLAKVKGMREAEADPWLIFCKLLFANFFV